MPENVQNGLVEGDSSIVLINKGGKAEFVGSLPPSGERSTNVLQGPQHEASGRNH